MSTLGMILILDLGNLENHVIIFILKGTGVFEEKLQNPFS